jgi:hypothetical protein
MPIDLEKFTDKDIMRIVLYGHPKKGSRCILFGPHGLLPCNLCRWNVLEHNPAELGVIFQLYCNGVGCLCQWCQIALFWEVKKRNLSLDIGKVVFDMGNKNMVKNSQLHIALETELYEELKKKAKAQNKTLSAYCVDKLKEDSEVIKIKKELFNLAKEIRAMMAEI